MCAAVTHMELLKCEPLWAVCDDSLAQAVILHAFVLTRRGDRGATTVPIKAAWHVCAHTQALREKLSQTAGPKAASQHRGLNEGVDVTSLKWTCVDASHQGTPCTSV